MSALNKVCTLDMPNACVLLEAEEMEYLEGGGTYYNDAQCYTQYQWTYKAFLSFSDNVGGTEGLGYVGYAYYIQLYGYQYPQYLAGYQSGNGVIYHGPWNIEVL